MKDKLSKALDEISTDKIVQAAHAKRRIPLGAIAAVLALALTIGAIIPLIHYNIEDADNSGLSVVQLAAPVYSQLTQRPNESEYLSSSNWENYQDAYAAWLDDQNSLHDQPEGYADSLDRFFRESIPVLLSQEENAACSPVNIYMALAMLAESASGNSRDEILTLLGAKSIEDLRDQVQDVWTAHYNDDGVNKTLLGNSLWLGGNGNYDMSVVQTLADCYYASVFQGTFGTEAMNNRLRTWLNEQTNGLLSDYVKNESFDPNTVLALASTIYYRANWADEFNEKNNITDKFTTADNKTRRVTYLCRTEAQTYYRGDNFGAISLSLNDGSNMWLVLPDEGSSVCDVLNAGEATKIVLSGGSDAQKSRYNVKLRLPKFDVGSSADLVEKLRELGITDIFEPSVADFSSIMPTSDAFVEKVTHAARVKIDEEGVEAAAYTLITNNTTCEIPQTLQDLEFYLDRPFLFYITGSDGLPLFVGTVYEP